MPGDWRVKRYGIEESHDAPPPFALSMLGLIGTWRDVSSMSHPLGPSANDSAVAPDRTATPGTVPPRRAGEINRTGPLAAPVAAQAARKGLRCRASTTPVRSPSHFSKPMAGRAFAETNSLVKSHRRECAAGLAQCSRRGRRSTTPSSRERKQGRWGIHISGNGVTVSRIFAEPAGCFNVSSSHFLLFMASSRFD